MFSLSDAKVKILTLSVATAAVACSALAAPQSTGRTAELKDASSGPIVVTVTTDKKSYAVGDHIKLTVTVRNSTANDVSLDFSSGQKYDFEIYRGTKREGPVVWQWSHGMMFTDMVSSTKLQAGKMLTFTAQAPDKNAAKPIPAGSYTVIGTLTTMPRTARPYGCTNFTIK